MDSAKNAGRAIGAALLAQGIIAPIVYFRLMTPATSVDFLTLAAGSALQVKVALLLTFILGGATLIASLMAYPVIRQKSERAALAFVAISLLGLATLVMETHAMRNMVALSIEYAKPGAATAVLETLGGLARTAWTSAHFVNIMLAHASLLVFFVILYRFRFIPRSIAGFGILASILSTATGARATLGFGFSFPMIYPAAIADLVLILWLLAKGLSFRGTEQPSTS